MPARWILKRSNGLNGRKLISKPNPSHLLRPLALTLLLLVLAGCSATRQPVTPPDEALPALFPDHSALQIVEALDREAARFAMVEARASADVEIPGQAVTLTLRIHGRRGDSLRVNAFASLGLEAARGLVTPDSFFVVDRLKRRLYLGAISAADQYLPVPATPGLLFESLTGSIQIEDPDTWTISADSASYTMRRDEGTRTETYTIDPSIWRVTSYELSESGETLERRLYGEFDQIEGYIFPRMVSLERPREETFVDLDYRAVSINPFPVDLKFRTGRLEETRVID